MTRTAYPRDFGSYVLLERLGAGGMSEVDLARRSVSDAGYVRFLVIKRMRSGLGGDDHFLRMFQDEARITAALSHENIAQVYDFGREGDELYLAMEYVPGLDLRGVQLALAARGRLIPMRVSLTILCGVLRALQYAHARVDPYGQPMRIVHRDVNPRNIMVSVAGEVKLIDFGVAKAADRLEKTESAAVKGKFAYMAPEQIEGPSPLDGRADLFAVGLVLHELVTGRSPFAQLSEVQIMHRLLSGKIPPLPDELDHPQPALLQVIHQRALAVDPADRYPDADAFRLDVERALRFLGGPAPAAEIAAVLREAGAQQVEDISKRLVRYRDGAPTSPRFVPAPPAPSESSGTLNVSSIREPTSLGWLPWVVGALGVLLAVGGLLVAGLGAAAWWSSSQGPAPAPVAAPAPTPTPDVPAPVAPVLPPEAKPSPRPAASRPSAAAATPARPAEPVASASATPAPAPTSSPVVAPAPAPAPAPVEAAPAAEVTFGYLNLTSRPVGMEVWREGRKLGATPLRMARVPVGDYDVVVRDPASGRSLTQAVRVTQNVATAPYTVVLE